MDTDRWLKAQQLFDRALTLPAVDREAFVATACGSDHELRQEVLGLLAADDSGESFIEKAVQGGAELALEGSSSQDTVRFGKYEIVEKIGEGGFGQVHKGRDPVLGRWVAIKTCSSGDEVWRQRFVREAQIASVLQHPNIVTLFDFGIEKGVPFFVQELLDGSDLNEVIAKGVSLSTRQRVDVLLQIARGMEHAHQQGVLHRDIKPANVRILGDGRVKILDFGIARLRDQESGLTQTGVALGTAGYLAPEQLRGEAVSERSDVFSFGALAYELGCGRRAFGGRTFSQVCYQLLHSEPEPIQDLWPECPPALEELVQSCMAKDAAQRCQSFQEIVAKLERILRRLDHDDPEDDASEISVGSRPDSAATRSGTGSRAAADPQATAGHEDATTLASWSDSSSLPHRRVPAAWRRIAVIALAATTIPAAIWYFGGRTSSTQVAHAPSPASGSASSELVAETGDKTALPLSLGLETQDSVDRESPVRAGVSPDSSQSADLPASNSSSTQRNSPATGREEPRQGSGEPAAATVSAPGGATDQLQAGITRPTSAEGAQRLEPSEADGAASNDAARDLSERERRASGRDANDGGPAGSRSAGNTSAGGNSAGNGNQDEPSENRLADSNQLASRDELPAAQVAGERDPGSPADGGEQRAAAASSLDGTTAAAPIEDRPPQLIERPEPAYPSAARRRKKEGLVVVAVLVDETGAVSRTLIKSISERDLGFGTSAREAASRARFEPAIRDGKPASAWTEISYNFLLAR